MPSPPPPEPTAGALDPIEAPAGAADDPEATDLTVPPTAPPTVSAFDRVQTRVEPGPSRPTFTDTAGARGAFWRVVASVVLLGLATGAAVWFFQRDRGGDADMLARLADVAADYEPALLTVDAAQASRYVEDASGWGIETPELPGLQLVGVGFADLSPQASVPAFRYDGADGESVVVFAYDYVFLDSIRGSLALSEPVYAGLADDERLDTRRLDGAYFVSWRRRAVIFTAVTDSEVAFERIGVGVVE